MGTGIVLALGFLTDVLFESESIFRALLFGFGGHFDNFCFAFTKRQTKHETFSTFRNRSDLSIGESRFEGLGKVSDPLPSPFLFESDRIGRNAFGAVTR